jgi:hypothetical protein
LIKSSGVRGGHAPEENHIFIDNAGDVGPGRLILAGSMHIVGLELPLQYSENPPVTKGTMGAQNLTKNLESEFSSNFARMSDCRLLTKSGVPRYKA